MRLPSYGGIMETLSLGHARKRFRAETILDIGLKMVAIMIGKGQTLLVGKT